MARRLAAMALLVTAATAAVVVFVGFDRHRPTLHPTAAAAASRPHRSAPRATPHRRAGRPQAAPLAPVPAQVRGAAAQRMPIPILMYHVVANAPPGTPNPSLWVTPAAFASEIQALRRAGYVAITLHEAYEAWAHGAPLPRRPVVLSFDDGYLGDYTHVRPVLSRLGWPGVLNLTFANLGPGGITPREVRALISAGWEVDSHTIHHVDVTTLDASQLREELVGSRAELRRRFGVPADFFCYPAGRYDARAIAAVKAAGYLAATSTNEGYAVPGDLYTLARIRVDNTDNARTLLARLAGERPRT